MRWDQKALAVSWETEEEKRAEKDCRREYQVLNAIPHPPTEPAETFFRCDQILAYDEMRFLERHAEMDS